jgi:hypothetical protein
LRQKDYLRLTAVHAMLGQALALTTDREGAIAAFGRAAELLPGDVEVAGLRAYWEQVIEEGLKELGQSQPPPEDR